MLDIPFRCIAFYLFENFLNGGRVHVLECPVAISYRLMTLAYIESRCFLKLASYKCSRHSSRQPPFTFSSVFISRSSAFICIALSTSSASFFARAACVPPIVRVSAFCMLARSESMRNARVMRGRSACLPLFARASRSADTAAFGSFPFSTAFLRASAYACSSAIYLLACRMLFGVAVSAYWQSAASRADALRDTPKSMRLCSFCIYYVVAARHNYLITRIFRAVSFPLRALLRALSPFHSASGLAASSLPLGERHPLEAHSLAIRLPAEVPTSCCRHASAHSPQFPPPHARLCRLSVSLPFPKLRALPRHHLHSSLIQLSFCAAHRRGAVPVYTKSTREGP